MFINYRSLLRKHGLDWLWDTNGKFCVQNFFRETNPAKLRTRLGSDLELPHCDLKKEFASFFKHSMKISKEFKILNNGPTESTHGNSRAENRNGGRGKRDHD